MPILFLLFLAIPVVEIYLLIKVGSAIGALSTVALVVLTAIIGAALLRHQGLNTINRVRGEMAEGKLPAMAMVEGVLLVVSGAFLLTPGFFTDTVGFLLLVPAFRRGLVQRMIKAGVMRATATNVHRKGTTDGDIIEGEFREIEK